MPSLRTLLALVLVPHALGKGLDTSCGTSECAEPSRANGVSIMASKAIEKPSDELFDEDEDAAVQEAPKPPQGKRAKAARRSAKAKSLLQVGGGVSFSSVQGIEEETTAGK
mmetsp:Transcript_51260/g.158835  ORF Transcript_51260/g.158835 Transcript_51260/m.158835 type:complete len:111 (+) Transcript_51260:100-432(+)|eukprot:CAMPEP_0204605640 /NCGR_PEP_ID=MMETSP0661-20131031/58606_1 /ASSEMBLY_ACC=CAM_ASM_000606 /TAXON_ID=109239 /ORGANISM="Alexandrium margalefi, Strain AMGDE01CS-322" /LENGTH=110 /DNA_ID=CAMNT_0051616893 /DNA_START=100 /DNA_END=432 /DNA_ORIENTATION=-